jgi:GH25 family lysozyme M1 (1,4-beta-N-acetylmuramidase)
MVNGIDVSRYQTNILWPAVLNEGYKFAFIKATEGWDWVDPFFRENWTNSKNVVLRGAYHFFRADLRNPVAQAEHFLRVIQQTGDRGDLELALDLEKPYLNGQPVDPNKYKNTIETDVPLFLEKLTGYRVVIYSSQSFINTYLPNSNYLSIYPLWVANYPVNGPAGYSPKLPRHWTKWKYWQYDNGNFNWSKKVTGKTIDRNFFNGTYEELIIGTPQPPLPQPVIDLYTQIIRITDTSQSNVNKFNQVIVDVVDDFKNYHDVGVYQKFRPA